MDPLILELGAEFYQRKTIGYSDLQNNLIRCEILWINLFRHKLRCVKHNSLQEVMQEVWRNSVIWWNEVNLLKTALLLMRFTHNASWLKFVVRRNNPPRTSLSEHQYGLLHRICKIYQQWRKEVSGYQKGQKELLLSHLLLTLEEQTLILKNL